MPGDVWYDNERFSLADRIVFVEICNCHFIIVACDKARYVNRNYRRIIHTFRRKHIVLLPYEIK
jgi:hypothetical protein